MSFTTILVANRGEIACRVIRTARRLGYRTVAVYSDADARAPHVALADVAVHLPGTVAADTYLRIDRLMDAARMSGADAVHPGYGFLSENADFARACTHAGLVFIGPPAEAIQAMGDKALAKRRMLDAGVPCAPGYLGDDQRDTRLHAEALALGCPLLVKAVAGGGGRGMRLVHRADEIDAALAGARREAQSAFGDGRLMLERLIEDGRHIEIQIFADTHGHVVHLGERDCTAQRRRQKVVEESPSPIVTPAMREAMGRDAVTAARAVGYVGAGTVEFIVDADLKHHFLEMNTRLQVEHPVTEMVTGHDLVEWQLRVAAGELLPVRQQDDITFRGHAIEVRLYAEDPGAGFAPQTGIVHHWRPEATRRAMGRHVGSVPADGIARGVRIDDGILEGGEVTPHYDPMLAKLIAHGRDRDDAIRRLRAALASTPLLGVRTNARFLSALLDHASFRGATMTTTLIDRWQADGEPWLPSPPPDAHAWSIAAALFALGAHPRDGWRPDSVASFTLTLIGDGTPRTLHVRCANADTVQVKLESKALSTVRLLPAMADEDPHAPRTHVGGRTLRVQVEGVQHRIIALRHAHTLHLALGDGNVHAFEEASPFPHVRPVRDATRALSPVAGKVIQLSVAAGDEVAEGQPLVCVEAMKMEMWVHAQAAGTVSAVHVKPGEQVALDALLVELTLTESAGTPSDPGARRT